jgi:hypothetical protein
MVLDRTNGVFLLNNHWYRWKCFSAGHAVAWFCFNEAPPVYFPCKFVHLSVLFWKIMFCILTYVSKKQVCRPQFSRVFGNSTTIHHAPKPYYQDMQVLYINFNLVSSDRKTPFISFLPYRQIIFWKLFI